MSEECKSPDGDYVMMHAGEGVAPGQSKVEAAKKAMLNDPNLSQEEKDHRLAVALQQQENAAAHDEHQSKVDARKAAAESRTARSATFGRLAAIRKKDQGMLSVPAEYTSDNAYRKDGYDAPTSDGIDRTVPPGALPQEVADRKLAADLQKLEQVDAGTALTMEKMVEEDEAEEDAQNRRTGRSVNHINQKKNPFVKK